MSARIRDVACRAFELGCVFADNNLRSFQDALAIFCSCFFDHYVHSILRDDYSQIKDKNVNRLNQHSETEGLVSIGH